MGRASSAKKVAKVARSSGGPRREQAKLGFPAAVLGVLVVGILMVVWAQNDRQGSIASAESPTLADHWHAAYGIYVCDAFQPGLRDIGPDATGIHTHDDGTVHVHPFSSASTGTRANWATFGEVVGLEFDGSSITLPDGTRYDESSTCGDQAARVVMYEWPADDPDAEPIVHTEDLGSVYFHADRLAFTIAVVPEGAEVPRPPSIPTLDNLSDVPGGTSTDTALPGGEGVAPVDPSGIDPAGIDPAGEVVPQGEGEPSGDGEPSGAGEPSSEGVPSPDGDAAVSQPPAP